MKEFIVTVDGPAGSGKSTIAKIIAKKYGFTYLDTGAMYRMIALYALENSIDLQDSKAIETMLKNTKLDIVGNQFFLNGKDVSDEIRTPRVSAIVSPVSAIKEVRVKLVDLQREISKGKSVILDGRDIGTVVFPSGDVKIYLVASPEERAKRRLKEYEEKGVEADYESVLASIKERDFIDSTRKESPLKKAEDAHEIDSSTMSIDEVVEVISKYIDEKIGA
ncbi:MULTISPECIES: (d)CMP kinase [Fusobacterium]|jgi:cytidylate kinase|uniref:Cytidylate kinase n=2 Tax=Fusobacterium mortiferum TaxID=850 RepID=A0A414Q0A9_FUSMR|nr:MULTISPECIES: (d)CMP kinase [Fusobacterium]AVQ18332.1 (d)CMP kinase [Fusobacterium mortiferum ATCC 9817]EEO34566.1 cytidylate kinase [Fusobacterium mortiferum ATCC 9817]MCF2626594.1 (d)CMP kinase [Fusobacterium mortiferum]MCF2699097.1 (d)CMP kinase [Fusobacterium mortiferum]MCI6381442.1 (d)CMP kinase [Fusobacterium mortiferum]